MQLKFQEFLQEVSFLIAAQTSTYNSYSHLVNEYKAEFYYGFSNIIKLWYYNRDLIGAIFVDEEQQQKDDN